MMDKVDLLAFEAGTMSFDHIPRLSRHLVERVPSLFEALLLSLKLLTLEINFSRLILRRAGLTLSHAYRRPFRVGRQISSNIPEFE